jgi:4-hydroxybenzoate polyprenyltransferase
MFVALVVFGATAKLGPIYYAAMPFIAGALIFEHRSARKLDLLAINRAFFQSNAFVSVLFVIAVASDLWI